MSPQDRRRRLEVARDARRRRRLATDELGDSHPISIAKWADHDFETRL